MSSDKINDYQIKIFKSLDDFERISAQGLVYDSVKKTVYACITGYDPNFAKHSPGNIIGLHSIKEAIKNKYKLYEFLQGADNYKLAFGALKSYPSKAKITNKRLKTKLINQISKLFREQK